MRGQAVWAVTKEYIGALLVTVLFPILWLRSMRFARAHTDWDPRGPTKVAGAIGLAVVLTAGAVWVVEDFRRDAVDGMYQNLDTRLAAAVGESEYQDWLTLAGSRQDQVSSAQTRLAEAQAAGDQENVTRWEGMLVVAAAERDDALQNASALEGSHQLYLRVHDDLERRDDAAAKREIRDSPVEYEGMQARADTAFAIREDAYDDMMQMYVWIVYPGIVGVFFAPLVFAKGHILRQGFEESEGVGFKPYPHGAMALFLFFGAFGVPALFFSAWAFMDIKDRAAEGQIEI